MPSQRPLLFPLQVAMLFLTMGKMRHKELWSLWLQQAAGRLPVDCLASATCGERQSERLLQAARECMTAEPGALSRFAHPMQHETPFLVTSSEQRESENMMSERVDSKFLRVAGLVRVARSASCQRLSCRLAVRAAHSSWPLKEFESLLKRRLAGRTAAA